MQQTVEVVRAVEAAAHQGWSPYAENYVVQRVGADGWAQLKRRWRTPDCKQLAALAAECDELAGSLDTSFLEGVPLVSELLQPLSPVAAHAQQAALLLRALGVAICAARGRLHRCACLKAMIDTSGAVPKVIVSSLYQAIPTTR